MKNIYIFLILFLSLTLTVNAQQRPQFSQYMVNNYLLNPAVAGSYSYTDLRFGFRDQWTNIEGAPRSFFLSAHSNLRVLGCGSKNPGRVRPTYGVRKYSTKKKTVRERGEDLAFISDLKHGVGGLFLYDETGAFTRTMFYGSYALHVNFYDKLNVSLGLQAGLINYNLDLGSLNPTQENDPALGEGSINSLVPDIGLGLMAYTDDFYLGLSLSQVLQNDLTFETENPDPNNKLFIHYYITGGYRIPLWNKGKEAKEARWTLIPSALVKILEGSPVSFDINGRMVRTLSDKKNHIWMGLSYRHQDALVGLLGISVGRLLDLNYSYDFDISDLRPRRSFNPHTHEVSIGLRLYCARKRDYKHNLF